MLVVEYTDYNYFPTGGQATFIRNLITELNCQVYLVGLSRCKSEIGRWTQAEIGGQTFPIFPVYSMEQKPPRCPARLWALHLIRKYRSLILKPHFDGIFIQSPEVSLPFLGTAIPLVFNMPGGASPMAGSKYRWARNRLFEKIYHRAFIAPLVKTAAAIISIDTICEELVRSVDAQAIRRLIKSSVAVNLSIFKKPDNKDAMRKRLGISTDAMVIAFSGRLEVVKGLELLLESFKVLSQRASAPSLLVICGDGTQKQTLTGLVHEWGLERRVLFTGTLDPDFLAQYLQVSDVFAMTSHYEGLPNAMLEAMACGLPVVSTNVGGIARVVKNNETGYLLSHRDASSCAKLLEEAYCHRFELGKNAHDLVRENYSIQTVARQID